MQKTRRAVEDALNGDRDKVDPALRRALYAVCTAMDDHMTASELAHIEMMSELSARMDKQDTRLGSIQKLLVSTTVTFVVAMATGLLNLIIN